MAPRGDDAPLAQVHPRSPSALKLIDGSAFPFHLSFSLMRSVLSEMAALDHYERFRVFLDVRDDRRQEESSSHNGAVHPPQHAPLPDYSHLMNKKQVKDKQVTKSMVVGRPILVALEDIDGIPSFLEKVLQYVEEHGKN